MRRSRLALACAAAFAAAAPRLDALTSNIGVYFDAGGVTCDARFPTSPVVFSIYILGHTGPDLGDGMTAAEFRVDGADPAWTTLVAGSPSASLSLGDPLQGGCLIAFASCQGGSPANLVLLYGVQVIAIDPIGPRVLEVKGHTAPAAPQFQCPNMVNCSAPAFGRSCVDGLRA